MNFTAYQGQMIRVPFVFTNPDRPQVVETPETWPRVRVYGPQGIVCDSEGYRMDVVAGTDHLPPTSLTGQVLPVVSGGYEYLLSIPKTFPVGDYRVEASAQIAGYPILRDVATFYLAPALKVEMQATVRSLQNDSSAYSLWFHTDKPFPLKLNRAIYQMLQADTGRLNRDVSKCFAYAKHERSSPEDLIDLTSYTLRPGWTRIVVSDQLWMIPVVDRSEDLTANYVSSARYANPYWEDTTLYNYGDYQGTSVFATADYGPGPIFYLYASDPQWGCRNFGAVMQDDRQLVASQAAPPIPSYDSRRMQIVCRPDFKDKIDYYAFAESAETISEVSARNHRILPAYTVVHDSINLYLNYRPYGPSSRHTVICPEFCTSGITSYYNIDVEIISGDPEVGGYSRFMTGYDSFDGRTSYGPPHETLRAV